MYRKETDVATTSDTRMNLVENVPINLTKQHSKPVLALRQ